MMRLSSWGVWAGQALFVPEITDMQIPNLRLTGQAMDLIIDLYQLS